jgi:hypothetical protein
MSVIWKIKDDKSVILRTSGSSLVLCLMEFRAVPLLEIWMTFGEAIRSTGRMITIRGF